MHGVAYTILATVNSSPTGFQATAYQRVDNGNIKIEFRGTQALGDWLRDDRVDFGMVKSRIDAQLPEADAFTRRVLAQARTLEPQYGHPLEVSVAGHSLGGVPGEVMAFRYKLSVLSTTSGQPTSSAQRAATTARCGSMPPSRT